MANKTKENEVKHTPGPWMIRHGERVYGDASRVLDADGQVVALIPPDDTIEIEDGAIAEILTPRARANAAIIAAAPEMLAALRDAHEALSRQDVLDIALDPLYRARIGHAIARAEGRR
jgi:hypothetical protein